MRYKIHEWIMIKEEMIRAYLNVVTQQSNGETKQNREYPQSG
jgi:hypothetical protein